MWVIHPLFMEIGKEVHENLMMLPTKPATDYIGSSGPTLWALVVLNSIEYPQDQWIFAKEEHFYPQVVGEYKNWALIIVAIIKKYQEKIKQTFNDYSKTRWGGYWEEVVKTAIYYDTFWIDGIRLVIQKDSTEYVVHDQEVEFSYPLSGFIKTSELIKHAINKSNVLEVLEWEK